MAHLHVIAQHSTVKQKVKAHLHARSTSRQVWETLREETLSAQVLAVFDRACVVVTDEGAVTALVSPQIGDGPLNIVLECEAGGFTGINTGTPVQMRKSSLQFGDLAISLSRASIWEPRADWERLRARREEISTKLPLLLRIATHNSRRGSLLRLFSTPVQGSEGPRAGSESGQDRDRIPGVQPQNDLGPALLAAARTGAEALIAGWQGDLTTLDEGVTRLAGLGIGLTPSGDDFLAGFMLWAWLAHPTPRSLCREIAKAAAPQTNLLSAAFLGATARGECSAAWHHLLSALHGDPDQLANAVEDVLSHGQTSGADALAGFLWMACSDPVQRQGGSRRQPEERKNEGFASTDEPLARTSRVA
jgi:hypothetical protein